MRVVYETILDKLKRIGEQADIADKRIKYIELTRGEASEFKGDIMRVMGPDALVFLGEFLKPLPFEGLIGQYNGIELRVVRPPRGGSKSVS